jgi:hypothetical protein
MATLASGILTSSAVFFAAAFLPLALFALFQRFSRSRSKPEPKSPPQRD